MNFSKVKHHALVMMMEIEDLTGEHLSCSHGNLWEEWVSIQHENNLDSMCAFHLKLRKLLKELSK